MNIITNKILTQDNKYYAYKKDYQDNFKAGLHAPEFVTAHNTDLKYVLYLFITS